MTACQRGQALAIDAVGRHRRHLELGDGPQRGGVGAPLEANSDDPLARAITGAATPAGDATDVHTVAGAGVTGTVAGHRIRLGSPTFVPPGRLTDPVQRMMAAGATVVIVERDDRAIGAIAVRDDLRDEAPAVVQQLQAQLPHADRATARPTTIAVADVGARPERNMDDLSDP